MIYFRNKDIKVPLRAKIDGKYDGYQFRTLTLSLAAVYTDQEEAHIEEKIIEVPVRLSIIVRDSYLFKVASHKYCDDPAWIAINRDFDENN